MLHLIQPSVMKKPFNVLLYLILKHFDMFGEVYGRKKIQKLVFLLEYTDRGERVVGKRGLVGYKFVIWLYGPYSPDLHEDIEKLVDKGLINERVVGSDSVLHYREARLTLYNDDGYPKTIHIYRPSIKLRLLYRPTLRKVLSSIAPEIDFIVEKYGEKTATELENYVSTLLKLTPEKKIQYLGTDVDKYLVRENIAREE